MFRNGSLLAVPPPHSLLLLALAHTTFYTREQEVKNSNSANFFYDMIINHVFPLDDLCLLIGWFWRSNLLGISLSSLLCFGPSNIRTANFLEWMNFFCSACKFLPIFHTHEVRHKSLICAICWKRTTFTRRIRWRRATSEEDEEKLFHRLPMLRT